MDDIHEAVSSPPIESTSRRKVKLAPLVSVTAGVGVILAVWASGATGTAAAGSPTAPSAGFGPVTTFANGPGGPGEIGTGFGAKGPGFQEKGLAMRMPAEDAKVLSACMRSNGYPSFPEPDSEGVITLSSSTSDIDLDDPGFTAQQQECDKTTPHYKELTPADKAAMKAQTQKISDCMHAHGIASFPNPDADGRLMIQASPGSELDPNDPDFQAAQQACQPDAPIGGTDGPSFHTDGLSEIQQS